MTELLILAGGESRRMGGIHKGGLTLGGETFTEGLIRRLSPHTGGVMISCGRETRGAVSGCRIVRDEYPGCGPMAGLHAGLKACRAGIMLAAACDMPFLGWEVYERLLGLLPGADAVIPISGGRVHPLAAVYTKNMLPVFEGCLGRGELRLMNALDGADVRYADLSDISEMLKNINTGEEYRALLK